VLFLHHLINGEQHFSITLPKYSIFSSAPELVRVRIINAGSMTNYKVFLPSNSTIIKADGAWVQPFTVSGDAPYIWVGVGQRYEVLVEMSTFTVYALAESFARKPLPHESASMHIQVSDDMSTSSIVASGNSVETPQEIGMATGNADDSIDSVLVRYPLDRVDFSDAINRTYRITGSRAHLRTHARTHAVPSFFFALFHSFIFSSPPILPLSYTHVPPPTELVNARACAPTALEGALRKHRRVNPCAGRGFPEDSHQVTH